MVFRRQPEHCSVSSSRTQSTRQFICQFIYQFHSLPLRWLASTPADVARNVSARVLLAIEVQSKHTFGGESSRVNLFQVRFAIDHTVFDGVRRCSNSPRASRQEALKLFERERNCTAPFPSGQPRCSVSTIAQTDWTDWKHAKEAL